MRTYYRRFRPIVHVYSLIANLTQMDKLARRIGKRIRELRSKKDLTSEALAYQYGISKGYLSDLENGKRLPSIKMLERLAKILKVDIKELF